MKTKSALADSPRLDRQITQAKAALRQLRDTLADLDDRRELARAKKRSTGKHSANWDSVKTELGFEF